MEIRCHPLKNREITQNLMAACMDHTLDSVLCGPNWQGLPSIYWASRGGLGPGSVLSPFDIFCAPGARSPVRATLYLPVANEVAVSVS